VVMSVLGVGRAARPDGPASARASHARADMSLRMRTYAGVESVGPEGSGDPLRESVRERERERVESLVAHCGAVHVSKHAQLPG